MSLKYDWSKVTKADLSGIDDNGNLKKVEPGTYQASITGIVAKPAKSGAFGVTFTYTITEGEFAKRQVKEGVYLTGRNGQELELGAGKLKRRMMQAGLTSDEILNFRFPNTETEFGDFKKMLDANVKIKVDLEEIKDGPGKGMKIARVVQVYGDASGA